MPIPVAINLHGRVITLNGQKVTIVQTEATSELPTTGRDASNYYLEIRQPDGAVVRGRVRATIEAIDRAQSEGPSEVALRELQRMADAGGLPDGFLVYLP